MQTKTLMASAAIFAATAFASAALMIAPASAAVINVSAIQQATENAQEGNVSQVGASVSASLGTINASNIDSSVTDLLNSSLDTAVVKQTAYLGNLSLVADATVNAQVGNVGQEGLSGILTGGVNGSNLTGAVLNSVNLATKAATITQK